MESPFPAPIIPDNFEQNRSNWDIAIIVRSSIHAGYSEHPNQFVFNIFRSVSPPFCAFLILQQASAVAEQLCSAEFPGPAKRTHDLGILWDIQKLGFLAYTNH
jgi:hypothetical protein